MHTGGEGDHWRGNLNSSRAGWGLVGWGGYIRGASPSVRGKNPGVTQWGSDRTTTALAKSTLGMISLATKRMGMEMYLF